MGTARYLVAKYVPDVFRNEPVNIGVLTWVNGKVGSRFLGQKSDGSINGKAAGVFGRIKSISNYKQWIESWVTRLKGPKIQTQQHGVVLHDSHVFLDALATYGGDNYILESGGEVMDETDPNEVSTLTDYLFNTLVGTPEEKEQGKSPEEMRDDLLRDAQVQMDERVKKDWPVIMELNGKVIKPKFNIYLGNGTPELLGQMVPLTSAPKVVQSNARATELLFLRILQSSILGRDKCIAFVYSREDEAGSDMIVETLEELSSVATIVNITDDRPRAVEKIRRWVSAASRH